MQRLPPIGSCVDEKGLAVRSRFIEESLWEELL